MEGLIFGILRYVQCATSRVDTSFFLERSCTFTHALAFLECLCPKSSIVDRFTSTVLRIQYCDNPCRNAMIITSSPHIVHVVSMLDVPSRFGSTSFQSKDVKGAQKSEFLFCVTKRSTKCTHKLKTNERNYNVQQWLLHYKIK